MQQPSSATLTAPSQRANTSEPPTSFDLLSPAYLAVFPIFVAILVIVVWLLMVPDARRPWSRRSHRHSTHVQLRQRGLGDAYEIAPEMWRGGGRFVGEPTHTHHNVGDDDGLYADRNNIEPRTPESMDIARGFGCTKAVPAMPGRGRHCSRRGTIHMPNQVHVDIPMVPMLPATSANIGGDDLQSPEHDRLPPPPYHRGAEHYTGSVRLVGREA